MVPRFRIAWVMVAVAIAALNLAVIRVLLGSPVGELVVLGALPMANVLAVGLLIGLRRRGSRPFLLGFEAFGAMASGFLRRLDRVLAPPGGDFLPRLIAPAHDKHHRDVPTWRPHRNHMPRRCGHARLAAIGLRPDWWLSLP